MPASIIKISQEMQQAPSGKLEPYVRIDFKVGEHGPFTEHLPKATYTAALAKVAVDAFARHIEQTQ
jgi:hypothetical protein